jgi:hypothetical protein
MGPSEACRRSTAKVDKRDDQTVQGLSVNGVRKE